MQFSPTVKLNARNSRLILQAVERSMTEARNDPNSSHVLIVKCTADTIYIDTLKQEGRTATIK